MSPQSSVPIGLQANDTLQPPVTGGTSFDASTPPWKNGSINLVTRADPTRDLAKDSTMRFDCPATGRTAHVG